MYAKYESSMCQTCAIPEKCATEAREVFMKCCVDFGEKLSKFDSKTIITALLHDVVEDTDVTPEQLEENVLISWKYILTNWDKLDDYNRGRVKLTEINSNMLNILIKLKEKPINKKPDYN